MTRSPGEARFLALYALANAGGVVAYTPLLTLLLPIKMAAAAGPARIEWLSAATLLGAISASAFAVLFGWASDLAGTRRRWVAAGLGATLASYAGLALADTPPAIVAAVVAFQAAVNLLLAPLAAWAADAVPDHRKGVLGGLLGAGPAVGALAGVVATAPALPGESARLLVTTAMIAALVLPLLVVAPVRAAQAPGAASPTVARRDFVLLWIARLLVQVAAVELFAFLFFYFQSLPDPPNPPEVARLIAGALLLGFPLTLLVGRVSDRLGPRRPFLAGAATAMAAGLAAMAAADARPLATAGYVLFGCGMSVFVALEATFAMQLLPRPDRHGRDLGLFNLANTFPSIIAPLLTTALVPRYGFGTLLSLLAGAVLLAGGCVLAVRCDRQAA